MLKRIFALFLAMAMVFTMLPAAAIAEDFEDEPVISEVTEPEETEAPEEATEPETAPQETEIPEESEPATEPEETEEAEDSEEPEVTELPEEEDGDEPADAIVASGTCGDNLTWVLDDEGTLSIFGTGVMEGYSGRRAPWYSERSSVKTVVIEDGVTSISPRAFDSCSSLTSVTISDSVTYIGPEAFLSCSSLTSVTVPNSVTSIGARVFYGCSSLTSVTISDSVTSIGDYSFSQCISLTSITIPESVKSIGESAFEYCSSLTSITIPEGVTNINDAVFSNCSKLVKITIPEGVTAIGNFAFENCGNLVNITIPESVKSIGFAAFDGCRSLTSIAIHDNVQSIGKYAFGRCYNIEKLYIGSIEKWLKIKCEGRSNPLDSSDKKTEVYVNGKLLEQLEIPADIVEIPNEAFRNWDSIKTVKISDSVSRIGKYAFYSCDNISSVIISESVTDLGSWAFSNCKSLEEMVLPDSVLDIKSGTFLGCKALKSVHFGRGTRSIVGMSFAGNENLKILEFSGDAPYIQSDTNWHDEEDMSYGSLPFVGVTATAYYPCSNPTWTEETRQDYSGKLTWVKQHQNVGNVCTGCGMVLGANLVSVTGPEVLRGGTSAAYKAQTSEKATVLWKLRPQDLAFASITSAGKLTTKAVAEPVEIVLTAYLKSNPEISLDYSVTIVPNAEEVTLSCAEQKIENGIIGLDIRESETIRLNAAVLPASAMQSGTWKSSSAKIAKVDANGLVTFQKNGTVTITFTASDGSKQKASVKIIAGTPAEGLTISGAETLISGGKATLETKFSNIPTIRTLTWTSSDPAAAAVSSKGVVTAKTVYEETEVTITARTNDGSGVYAEHILTVCPKADVLPIRENGEIVNGKTICLDANCGGTVLWAPEGTRWKSSAPGVASVEDGVITIKNTGTASITATSADGKQTGKVAVKISTLVRRLEIVAPGNESLISGKGKITLKANVNADATLKTVTWTSSDPAVAAVSSKGVVTAKAGVKKNTRVTITATAKDGSGEQDGITLTVVPAATMVNIVNEESITTADGMPIGAGEVLNGRTLVLNVGADFCFGAAVYPNSEEACARQNVTWSFSAKGIVGVSPDGTMTGLKPGSVTVTVKTVDGKSNTVKLKFV